MEKERKRRYKRKIRRRGERVQKRWVEKEIAEKEREREIKTPRWC